MQQYCKKIKYVGNNMRYFTEVKLKTIADIEIDRTSFYIDAYQRGYRWTESEVTDLLQDIQDFSQSGYEIKDRFYCLQPIVVTRNIDGESWKVIDGQQRLTTLYLIYLYYLNTSGRRKKNLPFNLHYKNKDNLESCLGEIQNGYSEVEQLNQLKDKYKDDIDCYFVITAYSCICCFFNSLEDNAKLRNRIDDMKKVFDNYMKIIWYNLPVVDEQTEVSLFTKINMGKIPLTNAELIKALLLKAEDDEITPFQDNIAIKWDEMESQLSDKGMWSFLVNDEKCYSTRIDLIFEIMAHELNEKELKRIPSKESDEIYYVKKDYNIQYFSFYVFNNYARFLKSKEIPSYEEKIWKKISEYYQMFRDWYQNRRWYHLIGYLVNISGKNYIDKLIQLSEIYREGEQSDKESGYKTFFERKLRKMVAAQILSDSELKRQDLEEYVQTLEYGSQNDQIKNLLLLYNISSLELLEGQTDVRFPFDKYKSEEIIWDIEHINAVADDRPNDSYDRENNACKIWLESTINMPQIDDLKLSNGESIRDAVRRVLEKKLYIPQPEDPGLNTFISIYETIIDYFNDSNESDNSIANLTLLDSGTNRSYKNDVFPLKRRKIIENCSKEIFIPICTKNVFLKAYTEADGLLLWTEKDKTVYLNDIVEKISSYLGLEDSQIE